MTLFYRLHPDQTQTPATLENSCAGPTRTACWLIGGGPSLARLPIDKIAASPLPKMCLNLAGSRLVRPHFWTSYDPSIRFQRSLYLDPGIVKFLHRRRAMDLVPETTFKVCECPHTYFFNRDGSRGFADFLSPHAPGIIDWADSLVQAIDILYRLGFRVIYLAGCELRIAPSPEQQQAARKQGVTWNPHGQLADFLKQCERVGLSAGQLEALAAPTQYHFDEQKAFRAAVQTDAHYFRIVQYLRLSRRSLSLAGLELISATPHSRLNDHFPYRTVSRIVRDTHRDIGNPAAEPTRGRYHATTTRHSRPLDNMRDYKPHNWPNGKPPAQIKPPARDPQQDSPPQAELVVEAEGFQPVPPQQIARLRHAFDALQREPKDLIEEG